MPIYLGLNIAYVHIPKTGGTSVAWNLYNQNKETGVPSYDQSKHESILDIISYAQAKEFSYQDFLRMFKFSVVRNPYDRIASWFFYQKKVYSNREYEFEPCDCVDRFLDSSFEEWLNNITQYGEAECESIECPFHKTAEQYRFVLDDNGNFAVDTILNTESLSDDWLVFCRGVPFLNEVPLTIENVGPEKEYDSVYTKEARELVYDLYQKDFEYFGYEK